MMWTSIKDFFILCVSKHKILADRHTAIIIWLCQSYPNLSRAPYY